MANGMAKRNILVVDDERQITRVLKTALSSRGYSIRTATDGDEALHIMQDWSPDIVITDLRMPNMDGLELCKTIRAKSQIHECYLRCGCALPRLLLRSAMQTLP